MKTDHWDKRTLDFLLPHLASAQEHIRIATGFFTVQGYDLLRSVLWGKRVYILVGYDETSKERLKQKLIDDIMAHLSRWDAPNRREAVEDLVVKLENGELRLVEQGEAEFLDARIRKRDHAKVYIVDNHKSLVGSSNLTVNGLLRNSENMACISDPDRVAEWVQLFDTYWVAPDTYDLTQALLAALRRWLGLSPPYDVYLKTIQVLVPEDEAELPRESYKVPTKYQLVVIERVLRQLKQYRGAMLVASTGLGKTIMATHVAHRLRCEGNIFNVIVFAPVQVQPDWKRALRSAGISYQIFTRNLLDQPLSSKRNQNKLRQIVEALQEVDDKYIIFVDESQHFIHRRRAKDGDVRHSFRRLVDVANQDQMPYVVLLTATPLTKGVADLNNQLLLLPHTAPPSYVQTNGQRVFAGVGEHLVAPCAWKVLEGQDFFDAFVNLPVCTVISTSQVAKNFATATPQGDYVEFADGKRWIPQIALKKIKVPAPLEREMTEALDQGFFRHTLKSFRLRGKWQRSESTIETQALLGWSSSPLALQEVVAQTIDGTYKADFIKSIEDRREKLSPILDALRQQPYEKDVKLQALCRCLRQFKAQGQKAIIFTERHATAIYLERALAQLMPHVQVANVVKETKREYKLKNFDKEVFDLILAFAPEANADKIEADRPSRTYDVFITTDAYGVGVNLQDASIVVNYDLAWTPETIIQRAGRILRFWKKPRQVSFYLFVGRFEHDVPRQQTSARLEERLRRLTNRARKAEKFSEIPVIPDQDSTEINSLRDLPSVTIEDLGLADITQIEEFTGVSRFLKHITELNDNAAYAAAIPDDISSAMVHTGPSALLYLLLKYNRAYHWMLYDITRGDLRRNVQEDALLDLIQCSSETPIAAIDPNQIEELAQHCKQLWCQQAHPPQPENIERICTLYLQPQTEATDLRDVLSNTIDEDTK